MIFRSFLLDKPNVFAWEVVMLRYTFVVITAITAVTVWCGFYAFSPNVSILSQSAVPTTVPDFRDKKIWGPAKDHIFINLEDGIPWSISYFYRRLDDPRTTGKETAFLWDIDTPVHKVLRWRGKESYQWLLRSFSWTPLIRGENMEPILRVDWSVGEKVIGATLLVYDGDSRQPSAWEVFVDPAVESDVLSPVKQEL